MGLRGPAPAPLSIRSQRGEYGEPAPDAIGSPVRPANLEGEAAALWDQLSPELARLGTMDSSALAAACWAWADYMACRRLVDANPALLTDKDTRCSMLGYLAAFERLSSRLGLTPADRAKLRIAPGTGQKPRRVEARRRA
jgi:P27 family predicted phage terminase small subunit